MKKFAHKTHVPVPQTKGDITAIIGKYGGMLLNINEDVPGRSIIMFQSNHATPRYLRIVMNYPVVGPTCGQECRRKWRALFNDIKFEFVAIDEGIKTFDQAFMAWIIGEDGLTLYEKAVELRLLPSPEDEKAA